jgi:8-oxo-dGTP pyrophosphatase MutT (NUDIX family)
MPPRIDAFGTVVLKPDPDPAVAGWDQQDGLRNAPHMLLHVDYATASLKLAGGKANPDETAQAAFERELFEETGFRCPAGQSVCVQILQKHGRSIHYFVCLVSPDADGLYATYPWRPVLHPTCTGETAGTAWVPLSASPASFPHKRPMPPPGDRDPLNGLRKICEYLATQGVDVGTNAMVQTLPNP